MKISNCPCSKPLRLLCKNSRDNLTLSCKRERVGRGFTEDRVRAGQESAFTLGPANRVEESFTLYKRDLTEVSMHNSG